MFVPGVNLSDHPIMCAAVQAMCEDRGDCFAILDASKKNVLVNTVTTYTDKYDTNYSAAYYPWCKISDPINNKFVWVPPSVVMAGAYSQNDKIGYEWYAVAGLNRGGLPNVVDV